jgi:hypothetical protein
MQCSNVVFPISRSSTGSRCDALAAATGLPPPLNEAPWPQQRCRTSLRPRHRCLVRLGRPALRQEVGGGSHIARQCRRFLASARCEGFGRGYVMPKKRRSRRHDDVLPTRCRVFLVQVPKRGTREVSRSGGANGRVIPWLGYRPGTTAWHDSCGAGRGDDSPADPVHSDPTPRGGRYAPRDLDPEGPDRGRDRR